MTDEDVLPGKELLEKTPTIKRFEYSPFGSEYSTDIDKDYFMSFWNTK